MKKYTFENTLISKKQLKQILAWSFTKYGSIKACYLADKLKNLGFKYASQAGISISIEDLRVPEIKNDILRSAQQEILNTEKICLKGKITEVERYQNVRHQSSLITSSSHMSKKNPISLQETRYYCADKEDVELIKKFKRNRSFTFPSLEKINHCNIFHTIYNSFPMSCKGML